MILAVAPALAPGKAAPYVTGAYIVFLAIVLVYVAIMATRLSRTERDLAELRRDVQAREDAGVAEPGPESGLQTQAERASGREPEPQPAREREPEAERVR